ncbi:site-specific DNA-methyltransferase [Algibacter sp. R77976]|uniref:site-specific DNA-methyltransferase n=1 Tax=Algibacter sp. R77976 TaxID=3093873 RepID=UPI0037CC05CD
MATEKKLNAEINALKKKLEIANNRIKTGKYGITWLDVPEAFEEESENQLPVLREVKEKAIKIDDDKPTHILIEGDNYHSLTCLNYTHKNKIDLIYIDPPYNTGSDGFTYKDKRVLDKYPDGTEVPKDHPLRHSYWLSFMSKRLELAKDLLSDTGLIYISIDDNEFAQLKLLCDRVFGEQNFIGNVVWFKKRKGSFLSNTLVSLTEYILVYSKKSGVKLFGGETNNSESQPIVKRTNAVKELTFPENFVQTKLKDGTYKAGKYGKGTTSTELQEDIIVKDGIIKNSFTLKAPFTWSQSFLDDEIDNETEVLVNTINFQPRVIRTNNTSFKAMPSFIDGRDIKATNEDAYELLKNIFDKDRPFSYSKPVNLIKKLIKSVSYFKDDFTVLDFFAGSGTTAQAVLELNKEENKNIKFILSTNNEDNNGDGKIIDDVCYPRVSKVIKGYDNRKEETIEGLGNSLKYYKTDFVGANNILSATDEDKFSLAHKAGYLLSIAENTLEEIELSKCFQFFENKKRATAIYFKEELTEMEAFLDKVEKIKKPITLYLFSWGNRSEFESLFDHLDHVTIKTIPQPILEIYKKIYNIVTI